MAKLMSREMKDSGIEWIGEIPDDWDIKSLKVILAERKENNNPIKTDFILSLTMDKGVIPYTEKEGGGNKAKEDLTAYKLAYPNDIVLNSMNVIVGSVGLSKYFGCVSPVYYMLYPKNSDDSVHFYNDIFQSKVFQDSLIGFGNGIMMKQSETSGKLNTIRLRIPMSKLNTVMLPYPTPKEQQKIVEYLDEKVSKIDKIITETTLSIEEYKKYKQSLITEAVTKGLNSDVEMKESGIEWIGEIPKQWEVNRLRNIADIARGTVDKNVKDNEIPVMLIQYTNIYKEREQRETNVYLPITVTDSELIKAKVLKGDVLLTASSETADDIGHSSVIVDDMDNHVFGSDILRIRILKTKMILSYKKYFMENYIYLHVFDMLCRGITRFRFSMDDFKSIKYVIPPLEEQQKIAKYLDQKCSHIDNLITQKQQLLIELNTYKKSLIYECVTGKRR